MTDNGFLYHYIHFWMHQANQFSSGRTQKLKFLKIFDELPLLGIH